MSKVVNAAKSFKKLAVADRNAVIIGCKLSDSAAAKELGITEEEVATGRSDVTATTDFDITPFQAHFQKPTTAASDASASTVARPAAKKRGPGGTRIKNAFAAVTSTPVPVKTFALKHHVSENCLRQPKRFFESDTVKVCVRKHKDHDGEVCIWTEPLVAAPDTTATTATTTA